jgi:hypothetical protein
VGSDIVRHFRSLSYETLFSMFEGVHTHNSKVLISIFSVSLRSDDHDGPWIKSSNP